MTEPPGARLRVALSGLTVAEYFRDAEGKDVLLFIDNIFRFTQAGSEVSALLGRMPSAVGYQPTLGTRNGRAAGAHYVDEEGLDHVGAGDLRSCRRLHGSGSGDDVRASRRDDEPVARHRRARHLSGGRSAGVDVAHSRPAHHRRRALQRGQGSEARAAALQGPAGHHRDPRHRRAARRRQGDRRARAEAAAVPLAAVLRRLAVHRPRGQVRADRRDDPRVQGDHRGQARRAARAGVLHGGHDRRGRRDAPRRWQRRKPCLNARRSGFFETRRRVAASWRGA